MLWARAQFALNNFFIANIVVLCEKKTQNGIGKSIDMTAIHSQQFRSARNLFFLARLCVA